MLEKFQTEMLKESNVKSCIPGDAVVVSRKGETGLISHTFNPVDLSPGFASNINLQFSVVHSHEALQIEAPFGPLPANDNDFQASSDFRSLLAGFKLSPIFNDVFLVQARDHLKPWQLCVSENLLFFTG